VAPGRPGATWIGTPGRLPTELAAVGVEPNEIDLVVLTHLHLDHVGWNLARVEGARRWQGRA
jgi:glyoxylase-like metal-dependent hydrolase (beta-lactamase superfamily II)